jgi:hypothetical protein
MKNSNFNLSRRLQRNLKSISLGTKSSRLENATALHCLRTRSICLSVVHHVLSFLMEENGQMKSSR